MFCLKVIFFRYRQGGGTNEHLATASHERPRYILLGSVGTFLRCGGIFDDEFIVDLLPSFKSEIILNLGFYLAKLRARVHLIVLVAFYSPPSMLCGGILISGGHRKG